MNQQVNQQVNQPQIDTSTDVSTLSYEQARDQLLAVVQQLESGNMPLQQSMELWEYGEKLTTHCKNYLNEAKTKIDEATAGKQQQA